MAFNESESDDNDPNKRAVIHIGPELNVSERVEKIENKTDVDIQCCCTKVCF